MKSQDKKSKTIHAPSQVELGPRRSCRERKQPKNEDYLTGYNYLQDVFGSVPYEDDVHPKRRRKNYRYEDSDDYQQGHRSSRKCKQPNFNKVAGLLQWRHQLECLEINVNYLPNQKQVLLHEFHETKFLKQICGETLHNICQNVEAIFINIQWGSKNQTLKDFKNLKIESNKLMSKGLVFIWAPKDSLAQLLTIMQSKDFIYVQNFQIINLDIDKARNLAKVSKNKIIKQGQTPNQEREQIINLLEQVNPCDLIASEASQFFNKSKRTLLMFKKNNNNKFQLRHQRTCDVVFDMPLKLGGKCNNQIKNYVYNMIQTLLPDCLLVEQTAPAQFGFKMLELWGDADFSRRGWINVVEQK